MAGHLIVVQKEGPRRRRERRMGEMRGEERGVQSSGCESQIPSHYDKLIYIMVLG